MTMRSKRGLPAVLTCALLAFMASATPALAQQSAIAGTVTDGGSGQPLPSVQVQVLSAAGQSSGSITNVSGRFQVPVAPGTYTLIATMIGYTTRRIEGVQVTAGEVENVGIALVNDVIALDPVQVTVGKRVQKATEAPAMVAVVSEIKIEEKVVASSIEHMKDVVGVDIINYGVSAGNVVVRGFNNIFSGAVHFLTDHRIASIPSLNVNLMNFVPSTDEDIARMEVVLGPGAALYGPNTANGVVHLITRSPLEGSNTTISVAGGERDIFKGVFRTSHLVGENFGIKVSGSLFRGSEWEYVDSTEVRARRQATGTPAQAAAFRAAFGITEAEAQRVGVRDYDIRRWGGEARADWRFTENGTAIFQVGRSNNTGLELTGLGGGQTQDWVYSYYQGRFNLGRLFAQAYLNTSDAGDSYLLRRGATLVDRSKMWVTQLQHGVAFADDRFDLIYGLDYRKTMPESDSTIYGRYEEDDEITEFGAYAQADLRLSSMFSVVGALRYDDTSVLEESVLSPRAALVFTPAPQHAFRATYNRAFSTPSTLNMFLDINGGLAPGALGTLGYTVRATGPGENGLSFQTAPGVLAGMRSPFTPAALGGRAQVLPVNARTLYSFGVGVLQAQGAIDASTAAFLNAQAAALTNQVSINLFNPVANTVVPMTTGVPDVPRMDESTTTTFELGYQGVIGNRIALAADVWKSERKNFTSPLTLWTPLLTLDQATLQAFLISRGLPAAQAGALSVGLGGSAALGRPPVPLAVATSPDIATLGADIITTYVNYGQLDLTGADLAVTAFLTPEWTLGLTGSIVSDDYFEPELNGRTQLVALNAPDRKGTVTLGYRGANNGFMGEIRGRYTSEFPANSADYVGTKCIGGTGDLVEDCVEAATIVDFTTGYQIPNTGATVQLYISNVLDADYRNFVGVPNIGRLALLQVKYDF
jgi:outer membrane receptor for ferrienterochelin and colicins